MKSPKAADALPLSQFHCPRHHRIRIAQGGDRLPEHPQLTDHVIHAGICADNITRIQLINGISYFKSRHQALA